MSPALWIPQPLPHFAVHLLPTARSAPALTAAGAQDNAAALTASSHSKNSLSTITTLTKPITLIKDAGRGAWLAKVDITSAFKVMPIHPDFCHLFGIRWQNKFYFAVRLTFGFRSSPKISDTLSEAICWILSNNYDIPYLIRLLDDFLIISPPNSVPAAHLLTTQKLFSELGIPLTQDKTEGPSTSIEFLGINLDSQKFLASLPKEKNRQDGPDSLHSVNQP
ncbi:Pro-Pol polyprotein [Labeo rohita]|uniref:ribonuclease H n=1 Tax=Labeo rohita TaxID=84645 RepID=A0ABQ8L6C3_LABRO|nr:Pro-Pol polyprotein [Labeo rohita]